MKKLLIIPTLICLMLLAFPSAALDGAKTGLDLWWSKVFPALLPFFICCGLMERLGFLSLFSESKRLALLPVALFGVLSGYPSGARLLGSYVEKGVLNRAQAQTLSYITNLCSPTFLITIISCGLYQSKRVFLPLLLAELVTVALFALVLRLPRLEKVSKTERTTFADAFSLSVTEAMLGILKVGGCIILCSVLSAVLFSIIRIESPLLKAIIGGCIELTNGCNALVSSGLPLQLQLALCSFFTCFGGLSVALQSACFLRPASLSRYLLIKLLMGLISGAIVYLITPWFISEPIAATLAPSNQYAVNALTAGGVLFSSFFGLVAVLLLSVIMRRSMRKAK